MTIKAMQQEIASLKETIAQQAEAIRLKGEHILQGNLSLALSIQPSPEILQARDERVAAACANLVNRFISGDGILNDTWVHEIEEALRTNEWRKYL